MEYTRLRLQLFEDSTAEASVLDLMIRDRLSIQYLDTTVNELIGEGSVVRERVIHYPPKAEDNNLTTEKVNNICEKSPNSTRGILTYASCNQSSLLMDLHDIVLYLSL